MSSGEIVIATATILAVILGPILAVLITRIIDDRRAARARQMEIFRTLMRTRKMPIHVDHVGALNLVEIEFNEKKAVIQAWRNYLSNLSEPLPQTATTDEEQHFNKKRDTLLTKLIHEIASSLRFKVEQLDIMEGNYHPQGWNDDELEQRLVRRGLIDLLQGRKPLGVTAVQAKPDNSPYPPPPE